MPFFTISRREVLLSFTSSNIFLLACHVHRLIWDHMKASSGNACLDKVFTACV